MPASRAEMEDAFVSAVDAQDMGAAESLRYAIDAMDEAPATSRGTRPPRPDPLRQIALGSKQVAQGALYIPDAIIGGVNAVSMLAGSDYRADTTGQAMERFGAYSEETRDERMYGDINRGGSGAVSGLGLGNLLTRGGSAVTRAVGEILGTAPAKQIISSVTGSLSAGVARESGVGPWGQMAFGMAGGAAASTRGGLIGAAPETPILDDFLSSGPRKAALSVDDLNTTAAVSTAARNDVTAARAPYGPQYGILNLDNTPVPTTNYNRATEAAGSRSQLSRGLAGDIERTNTLLNVAGQTDAGLHPVGRPQTNTGARLADVRVARTTFMEQAKLAREQGQSSLATHYDAMAEGLQRDIDNALMNDGARRTNAEFAAEVPSVYGPKLQASLAPEAEQGAAWAQIKKQRPETNRRLALGGGELNGAVRRKMFRDLVQAETDGTSSWAVIKDFKKHGLDSFLTPAEFAGLERVTRRLSNGVPITVRVADRTAAGTAGYLAGGPWGAVAAVILMARIESMAATLTGRRFLEGLSTMSRPQVDSALFAVSTLPIAGNEREELP